MKHDPWSVLIDFGYPCRLQYSDTIISNEEAEVLFTTLTDGLFVNLFLHKRRYFELPQFFSNKSAKSTSISSFGADRTGNFSILFEPRITFEVLTRVHALNTVFPVEVNFKIEVWPPYVLCQRFHPELSWMSFVQQSHKWRSEGCWKD